MVVGSVLVAGLTVLDHSYYGLDRLLPNIKNEATSRIDAVGGPAANAAINIARMNASATLVTALGPSVAAAAAKTELSEEHVQIVDMWREGVAFPEAAVIVDATGDRTIISNRPSELNLAISAVSADQLVSGNSAVLLDGHYPNLAKALAASATRNNLPVVMDLGHIHNWTTELIELSDVVIATGDLDKDPSRLLKYCLSGGAKFAAVSRGAESLLWMDSDLNQGSVMPPPVEAIDTNGAGDVLHGVLVQAIASKNTLTTSDILSCVEAAVEAASRACAHAGARITNQ